MLYKSLAAGVIAFGLPAFSTTLLYTTSYGGGITVLDYANGNLTKRGESAACGVNPSWLEFAGSIIYCVNELWAPDKVAGNLFTLKVNKDGTLDSNPLGKVDTGNGPVSIARYGNGLKGVAVANYGNQSIQTFDGSNPGSLQGPETFYYPRNDVSDLGHPHQVLLDSTGDFIVVPDLGWNLLRIFKVDKNTAKLKEAGTVDTGSGPSGIKAGPRHGVFHKIDSTTYYYVITEKSNELITYKVTYTADSMTLAQQFRTNTHGKEGVLPSPKTAGAEIAISPDGNFLVLSSRFEEGLNIISPLDGTEIGSDYIISFSINKADGKPTVIQEAPSGGKNPRHFSISKDGTMLATVAQQDKAVFIYKRDVQTGKLGDVLASYKADGEANFVAFRENSPCA